MNEHEPSNFHKKLDLYQKTLFQVFGPHRETVQINAIRLIKVILACLLAALAYNLFLDHGGMYPAGLAGLTRLIQMIAQEYFGLNLPYAPINIILNAIPAAFALVYVGKKFLIFSLVYTVGFSLFVQYLPHWQVTDDLLLITIFGAVMNGSALAIALNANASGGGTDFIAMIFSNKYNISVFNYVYLFNVAILCVAGVLFGAEAAMYSMVYQLLSTQVLNRLHARYQRKTVIIISDSAEPIATDLMKLTHHGVTTFEGIGRYTGTTRYMLYMVVSKTDMPAIRHYVHHSKQKLFMNIATSELLEGRFYMKPLE